MDYNGLMPPKYPDDGAARIFGDKRDLVYHRGLLQVLALDLSNANPQYEIQLAGDVIYLDRRSTGQISIRPDMSWQTGFPLAANSAIRGMPYQQLLASWAAQAGKFAYVWCGYGVDIVPPNQDIASIANVTLVSTLTSITNAVTVEEQGNTYGVAFDSATNLLAGGNETLIAPASNTNGLKLIDWQCETHNGAASFILASLHANNAAPASYGDGELLAQTLLRGLTAAGSMGSCDKFAKHIRLPSGLGLYKLLGGANESNTRHRALWTLL